MARRLNAEEGATLEKLIDNGSLARVIEAISDICGEKADHIRTNWPDAKSLARYWDTAAKKLGDVEDFVRPFGL